MFVRTRDGAAYRALEGVTGIGVEPVAVPVGVDQPGRHYWTVYLERGTAGVLPSREYVGPEYRDEDDAHQAAKKVAESVGIVELDEPKDKGDKIDKS